jgi:transcriptional regulator with XRE-family HTH domain
MHVDEGRDGTAGRGIGVRVRAARERLGWNREALAFHSGISWAAIAQVESGRRPNARPGTLTAIARSLGVSIDYLVNGMPPQSTMLRHSLFAYRTDDQFRMSMGPFLSDGIERSEAVLAVTTGSNVELLREHLAKGERKAEFVDARHWYTTPIAALTAFRAFADAKLASGALWVRIIGEPVWTGRSESEVRLWARYESLLNLVFSDYPMTVVCPYDERSVAPEILGNAHHTHPHTLNDRGILSSCDYTDPGRFVLEPE